MFLSVSIPDPAFHSKLIGYYDSLKLVRRKSNEIRSFILNHPNFPKYCDDRKLSSAPSDPRMSSEWSEEYGTLSSNVMFFINRELDISNEKLYTTYFVNKYLSVVEPLVQALELTGVVAQQIQLDEHDCLQLWRLQQIDYSDAERKLDQLLVTAKVILDGYNTSRGFNIFRVLGIAKG
jgi:hypothetical protein